jgi:hypothetical protein
MLSWLAFPDGTIIAPLTSRYDRLQENKKPASRGAKRRKLQVFRVVRRPKPAT